MVLMRKIPDLVSQDDIKDILEHSNSNVMREMVDPVKNALNLFEKNISRLIFLPDIPRIEFRTATMHLFLDTIAQSMKATQHRKIMKDAGLSIGMSLGNDMIEFLMGMNKLPKDYNVMIDLWNEWDSIAGWGKRTYDTEENTITIIIEDSFLNRTKNEDMHKHCSFMRGYIEGFLRVAIKEQYRWFKRSITEPPYPPIKVVEVSEEPHGQHCKFVVKLGEEELKGAFDTASDARQSLRDKNLDSFARFLRTSIEIALKEKVNIDKDEKTSALKIVKALKQRNVSLSYNVIDDIYASTSRVIHGSGTLDEQGCLKMMKKGEEVLEGLESLVLLEDQRTKIKNEVLYQANTNVN
jgi:predicted hydrocarbon binding protein